MTLRVPRTCTEVAGEQRISGLPLAALRERPAYVLLGEPGAGKTTAFEMEAEAAGTRIVPARDFIDLGPPGNWQRQALFIDGLDETRAGNGGHFGAIRAKLAALGNPPFRISCREADWRGANDQDDLERVSADGGVALLHLEDLTDEQIAEILATNHGVADPQSFIRQAGERRLGGLLRNPQTLEMLAEAVPNRWPDSLAEAYALACEKLAAEPNKRHRDAQRGHPVAIPDLLDAAGHTFAVQLLANVSGVALDAAAADAAHPELAAIGMTLEAALARALDSRLFESRGQDERREPAHRSIAEFLGARYLAGRIDRAGLPLGRAVALMAAQDGGIVADLRGLHAWLAVHSLSARPGCIARDPLGVVLYGDPRDFNAQDKQSVLAALGEEAKRNPSFRFQNWDASPFGALAGPDMSAEFLAMLESDRRDEAHESLLDCVLEAIAHGEPMPNLGDALLAVARDGTHWPLNRKLSIDAYVRVEPDAQKFLLALLNDIKVERVEDGDDELAGRLLAHLYPRHIAPAHIVDYLHPRKQRNLIGGRYERFWERALVPNTAAEKLPNLLDDVAARKLKFGSDQHHIAHILGELLAVGLETAGERVVIPRLWTWLGIGLDDRFHCRLREEHETRIAEWLERRPSIYMGLLEHSLAQVGDKTDYRWRLMRRLHGAKLPAETEDWCFGIAAQSPEETPQRSLFAEGAFSLVRRLDYTPALLDAFLSVAERYPALKPSVDRWLQSEWEEWRQDEAREKAERAENEKARIAEWVSHFREHHADIEAGTAPPGVMHELAKVYYGRYYEAEGNEPIERLRTFFGNDASIVLASLAGLRRTLQRGDLPTVEKIVELGAKGDEPWIADACLAGANELAGKNPEAILELDAELQARLVAFRLTHDYDDTPAWFPMLVRERPRLVADVLIAYGRAMFKVREPQHIAGISMLAYDDDYGGVAQHAALPLLDAFPLRWKKERLASLAELLIAAARHANREALLAILDSRLSRVGLDTAQRGYWLAAGLALDPPKHEVGFRRYLGGNQSRAMLIAGFFRSWFMRKQDLSEVADTTAALLIRTLAPGRPAEVQLGPRWVTVESYTADLVRNLISHLGSKPNESAADALDQLLAVENLKAWHGLLRRHRESQRIAHREANFRRASAPEVVRALANAEPASAADLQALLVQHLRDIARDDRNSNTTGYERYWKGDTPHLENYCRDRLLEILRERLKPTRVDAQPEGEYRDNTRADIRAAFNGFNVPVEIKRDRHKDFWKALHDQLIAQYVCDPGADGYGIYLVFWFGGNGMPTAADGGRRPGSAEELEARLRATLTREERLRIEVIVMDCAPAARPSAKSPSHQH